MDRLEQEIERAARRAAQREATTPKAVRARYDRDEGLIIVDLSSGYRMSFAAERAQGLADASPSDLAEIEITPSGYGLHWPKLDADLWLPALLEDVFGSRNWMAARLGAEGGKATSDAKAAAARENGKRGGRPRNVSRPWRMRAPSGGRLAAHPMTASRPAARGAAPASKAALAPAKAAARKPAAKSKKSKGAIKSKSKKIGPARRARRTSATKRRHGRARA